MADKIIRSLNIVYTEKTMFLSSLHYALSLHFAEVIFRVTDFFIHEMKFKELKK